MPFKVFTSTGLTAADLNDFLMEQSVITCTVATRPTPQEGMVIYETDTDTIRVYEGTTWRAIWRLPGTYTPTLVGMAIGTGGSAGNTANWSFSGGTLLVSGSITFGTTAPTFPGATITASLPAGFTAVTPTPRPVGVCTMNDVSSGVGYLGTTRVESGTTVRFLLIDSASTYAFQNATSTTTPMTWAAGDAIFWSASITGTF